MPDSPDATPSPFRYALSFLLVSACWGLTTPFLRLAAVHHTPRTHPPATPLYVRLVYTLADFLRNPRYALPLIVNLTGSVWFFLLIGKAELSLTVPIVNSLALLWTVLGEWALGERVGVETWGGVACVAAGVWLCVVGKS